MCQYFANLYKETMIGFHSWFKLCYAFTCKNKQMCKQRQCLKLVQQFFKVEISNIQGNQFLDL